MQCLWKVSWRHNLIATLTSASLVISSFSLVTGLVGLKPGFFVETITSSSSGLVQSQYAERYPYPSSLQSSAHLLV